MAAEIWWAMVIGMVPLAMSLLWWWNDIWYGLIMPTLQSSKGATNLPPGHMGLPIVGEMFNFFWYFNFLGRPDDYINSKRQRYGDDIGLYRTHLFGKPSVIAISPTISKYVFRDDESFVLDWPNVDVVGRSSIVAVQGHIHARLRTFVNRTTNTPDALRQIALTVQPRIISALQSWAKRQTITCHKEIKKVTFENIGKYFAGFEPGPTLDMLDKYYIGLVGGLRAYPINLPGTSLYNSLKCREKLLEVFREEMDKRKQKNNDSITRPTTDLMDGLMNMKDDEGKHLSDIEVLDNIVSILFAGYESTTLATMWAIYHLAKYPKVLQKLRDENMDLKKNKRGQLVTSDEILKLKYTFKVVDETIRMANISGFVFRRAKKDINYKGYTIPKGWNMILWLRYVHTNVENFQDPMCFNPDRWDDPITTRNFQGFGDGLRTCSGNMLARLQVGLFLHHLSTGYKWELVNPDAKMKYLPHPKPEDGVEITIEKL